jgi:hypothetical protein
MHPEVYADGVDQITVSGSIVRVDLVSLSPTERGADNNPKSVFRQRLIFSIEGFANSVEVMQKALQGLVDAGAVKRNPPKAVTGTLNIPSSDERERPVMADEPRPPNSSVNFR